MAAEQAEVGENETGRRPYKISGKNKQFKGIVASSLDDLKSSACIALKIPFATDLKVFLDEDLTEVDNDEYFQFLPAQTKLIVLQQGEVASLGLVSNYPISNLERSESLITRNKDCTDGGPILEDKLKQRIMSDQTFYVNLTDEELESFIALDPNIATLELKKTTEEIILYQETCERELMRRSELRNANELLKLYHRAVKVEKNDDSKSLSKKLKLSHAH